MVPQQNCGACLQHKPVAALAAALARRAVATPQHAKHFVGNSAVLLSFLAHIVTDNVYGKAPEDDAALAAAVELLTAERETLPALLDCLACLHSPPMMGFYGIHQPHCDCPLFNVLCALMAGPVRGAPRRQSKWNFWCQALS